MLLLRLGGWEASLYAATPHAEKQVRRFWRVYPYFLSETVNSGKLHLVVATSSSVSKGRVYPSWLSEEEYPDWIEFDESWKTAYEQFRRSRSLSSFQDGEVFGRFTFSWPESNHRAEASTRNHSRRFSCLVVDELDGEGHLAIFIYSLFLAGEWHALHGDLCLHAAAAMRRDDGFLFLGKGGGGKSTVSRLSVASGYPVLGDDLNFVLRDGESGYLLASGPSVRPVVGAYSAARPALRGIFSLVQDKDDYLVPLSPVQAVRKLFDSFMQTPPAPRKLSDEVIGCAFRTVCRIAQDVPSYELHFRKSPDFWRLVDEQFPG